MTSLTTMMSLIGTQTALGQGSPPPLTNMQRLRTLLRDGFSSTDPAVTEILGRLNIEERPQGNQLIEAHNRHLQHLRTTINGELFFSEFLTKWNISAKFFAFSRDFL